MTRSQVFTCASKFCKGGGKTLNATFASICQSCQEKQKKPKKNQIPMSLPKDLEQKVTEKLKIRTATSCSNLRIKARETAKRAASCAFTVNSEQALFIYNKMASWQRFLVPPPSN